MFGLQGCPKVPKNNPIPSFNNPVFVLGAVLKFCFLFRLARFKFFGVSCYWSPDPRSPAPSDASTGLIMFHCFSSLVLLNILAFEHHHKRHLSPNGWKTVEGKTYRQGFNCFFIIRGSKKAVLQQRYRCISASLVA